jgi:hypothetical protein
MHEYAKHHQSRYQRDGVGPRTSNVEELTTPAAGATAPRAVGVARE